MERKDYITIKGWVNLKVFRGGKLIEERDDHNLIQTLGISNMAQYITGEYTGDYNYMGIGTGGVGGDNAALTALVSEVKEDGTAGTIHHILSSRAAVAGVATMVCTFNMTGTAAISEIGLFDATPDGDMLARQTFADLNLVNTDSLQITWTITVS